MITLQEFEKVQRILKRAKSRAKDKHFAYTGMMRCAECGSIITAEEKVNRFGSHYTYYHCAKRKGGAYDRCKQKIRPGRKTLKNR